MKQKFETEVMEQLKKGFQPVYYGEEGFIAISMKAYLAAAECAGAERSRFCYGEVCFDLIDVIDRSEEIEAEDYDFMPAEIEWEDADSMAPETESEDAYSMPCNFKVGDIIRPTPEARSDDIFSDLEDIDLVYRAIDEKMSNLGGAIYYLKSWREDLNEIRLNEKLEDLSKELNRYEAIFDRIVEYEKVRKQMEVKKDD